VYFILSHIHCNIIASAELKRLQLEELVGHQ